MKLFLIFFFLFSLQSFGATLIISSPQQNAVIRDQHGRVDLEGTVNYGANPPAPSNRGKVTCGSRQVLVRPDHSWKINNYSFDAEGTNQISCTFRLDNDVSTKVLTVIWTKTNLKPEASFVFTPSSGRAPLVVSFDSSGSKDLDGTIVSRTWNFGDGTTGTGQIVSHTFLNSGSYSITLTVKDNEGAQSSQSKTLFVDVPSQIPVGTFSPNPSSGEVPLQVTFDASLSHDPDGGIIREYTIDFGDGSTETSALPYLSHTYETEGNFTAKLQVKDDENEMSVVSEASIQVFQTNMPPVAKIIVDSKEGFPPLNANFSAAESYDEDGQITSYTWHFPNGETKTGVNVNHVFYTPGTFKVLLVVRDNKNVPAQDEVTITVGEDTELPLLSVSPESGSLLRLNYPVITLNHRDQVSGINLATVKAYLNGNDVTSRLQKSPENSILAFTLEDPLPQGTHSIRFEVSDNAGNSSVYVADYTVDTGTVSTSYLVGKVIDQEGNPIPGVSVQDIYAPTQKRISQVTNEVGEYKIPFSLPGRYTLSFSKPGHTESVRTISPSSIVDTWVGEVTLGSVDPIVTPIVASEGGVAENSTGTTRITFPPGALPFDMNFNVTEYVNDATMPGPLPEMSEFTYAFNIQAPDVIWGENAGVKLELDNYLGFPIGTEIPYGIFDRSLGRWLDSGKSIPVVASRDGGIPYSIPTREIGDINFPTVCGRDQICEKPTLLAPPTQLQCPPVPPNNNISESFQFGPGGPGGNLTGSSLTAIGCVINMQSGDLGVEHFLPTVFSGGSELGLKLSFHSTTAEPSFLAFTLLKALSPDAPKKISLELHSGGEAAVAAYPDPPPKPQTVYRAVFQAKNPEGKYFPTGTYRFDADTTMYYENSEYATAAYFGAPPNMRTGVLARVPLTLDATYEDRNVVVNRRISPFGYGWGLAGLERVYENADGIVTWEDGDRLATYYMPIPSIENGKPFQLKTEKLKFQPEISSVFAMNGLIYATDCRNSAVYRISSGNELTVVAGNGEQGFSGDGGPASLASLNCPVAIAPAETGGFYIADKDNNRIRKVDSSGVIRTIAYDKTDKPLSVSEDKMRAVYYTTENAVKLVSPRGDILNYASIDSRYVKVKLSKPSQVIFDHQNYPIVLDQESGKILIMVPQNRAAQPLTFPESLSGLKGISKVRPKSISFDPVLRIYYVLDATGKLFIWEGLGSKKYKEISFDGAQLRAREHSEKSLRIHSMTFSPETGMILTTARGLFKTAGIQRKSRSIVQYNNYQGFSDKLTKLPDGTYELETVTKVRKVFDTQGKISAVITPHGKNIFYQYQNDLLKKILLPGGAFFEFFYDSRGYVTEIRDHAGRTTEFSINSRGHVSKIINPDGTEKIYTYSISGEALRNETDEDGKSTTYIFKNGRNRGEILPGNRERGIESLALAQIEGVLYNGQLYAPGPQEIHAIVSSYSGDCINKMFAATLEGDTAFVDCLNRKTTYKLNENSWKTDIESPERRTTKISYANDRVTFIDHKNGPERFFYEDGRLTVYQDALNKKTQIEYNEQNLPALIKDPYLNETALAYDEFGNLSSITNATNKVTTMEYDGNQNLFRITDPLNQSVTLGRDDFGNINTITDAEERVTSLEHDEFNRILSIRDPKQFLTSFTYTAGGKLKSLTNAKNQMTSYEYHPTYFKVSRMLNPANQEELYSYNGNEKIVGKTNYDGSIITFHYDQTSWFLGKSSPDRFVEFTRDNDGLIKRADGTDGDVILSYDTKGRLRTESSSEIPGSTLIDYNSVGLPNAYKYGITSDLLTVSFTYDDRQLPIRMNAMIAGLAISWERYYDVLGRPQQDVLSNGMKVNYSFDDAGRLSYLSNEMNSETPIARFEYEYNPAGTIKKIVKSFTRPNQSTIGRTQYNFGYDELDRLTSASGEPNFVYDELGNHLQRGGEFNNLNHLLEDNEFTYSYTVNGELSTKSSKISGERTEYTWDDWGKNIQTRVLKADGSVKFNLHHKYDGFDRRISKATNGVVTKFFYHGEDIVAEFTEDNKLLALYLHGPGIDDPIAMVRDVNGDESFSNSEIFFYAKDHLGSVHALVDINGKIVQRYSYSAYGRTRVEKIHEDDKIIKNPYAYTSREWEQETGDYFNRMRFYNPLTGRFLSLDPYRFKTGDSNLYRYVKNNPIGMNDPFGLAGQAPGDFIGPVGDAVLTWGDSDQGGLASIGGGAVGLALFGPIGGLTGAYMASTTFNNLYGTNSLDPDADNPYHPKFNFTPIDPSMLPPTVPALKIPISPTNTCSAR